MKIIFLTSSHYSLEDRIFYHLAVSLAENGHHVLIVSSIEYLKKEVNLIQIDSFNGNNLSKNEKIKVFVEKIKFFMPDRIIVSEPLTVWAAYTFIKTQKTKPILIYDITEWYPSKKNLIFHSKTRALFEFFKLLLFNWFVSCFVDKFIFGEYYKSLPYRLLFPFKSYVFLSYYPSIKYLNPFSPRKLNTEINISYSGKLTKEKGFDSFLEVIKMLSNSRPNFKINIKIIGWYISKKEEFMYKNIIKKFNTNVDFFEYDLLEFKTYIETIKDSDVFLDLRDSDFENQHCLPIKLFYYLGLNRPVIFTNLKAIRKEINVLDAGYLVDNENIKLISNLILNYIDDADLYNKHCQNALYLFEKKYNWELIEQKFHDIIA